MTPRPNRKKTLKGRGCWCGPGDAGRTPESVAEFAERLKKSNMNTVLMEIKGGHGRVRYPSKKFPQMVEEPYKEFDMMKHLVEECHKRDIMVHAWFINYPEGGNSPAALEHPEWLMRNPQGEPTTSEILRGHPYGMAWMCPARRPGYTDQWLVPMMAEVAEMYDVDAVHHDYVRYPGDLAPDTYCYCDDCLTEMPRWAGLYSEKYPNEPLHPHMDRPHLEAHWEMSPNVLPSNWDDYTREAKSAFLHDGNFFPGGPRDLDYFWYTYRTDAIWRCCKETYEAVQKVNPKCEVSAAVFKNAIHAARFMGQDWRNFPPYVQYAMPMDYREHYPGNFDMHLNLFEESVERQIQWAHKYDHLWIGVGAHSLGGEERRFVKETRDAIEQGVASPIVQVSWDKVVPSLRAANESLDRSVKRYIENRDNSAEVLGVLDGFMKDFKPDGWMADKMLRIMKRAHGAGAEGLIIFCAGALSGGRIWDDVGDFFGEYAE